MNKKILTEINRVREIMGVGRLLVEQGRILSRITKLMAKEADTTVAWFAALKKAIKEEPKYKKFGDKIPLRVILNDLDLIDTVELIIGKQTKMTRVAKKGQTMGSQFRGAGLDISDDAALKLGQSYNSKGSIDDALDVLQTTNLKIADDVVDVTPTPVKPKVRPKPKEIDLNKIFSKSGKEMSEEIKPITEVLEGIMDQGRGMVTTSKELRTFFKDIGLPKTEIDRIIDNVFKKGKDISNIEDIRKIFGLALENTNFRKEIIDEISTSPVWQDYVGKYGWSIDDVAGLLGRDANDAVVKNFYKTLQDAKWFKKWLKTSAKNVLLSPTAKIIYKTLFWTGMGGMTMNFIFGRKYMGRGKGKAALSPDMYIDVQTNKELIKDEGGWTDKKAQNAAEQIYNALQGQGTMIDGKLVGGVSRAAAFFGNVDEETILKVYDDAPTILACSQIAYWYDKGPNGISTTGTLKKALEDGMKIKGISQSITSELGDVTIKEVYDTVKDKPWGINVTAVKDSAWTKRVTEVWPRYKSSLTDYNENPVMEYFSRLKGPIDKVLLGKLLSKCNPQTGKDMTTCLANMNPVNFNEVYAEHFSKKVEDLGDAYSETYTKSEAVDTTKEFEKSIKEFVDGEGEWGQSFLDYFKGTKGPE